MLDDDDDLDDWGPPRACPECGGPVDDDAPLDVLRRGLPDGEVRVMWWIFSTMWLLFGLFVSAEASPYTEEMAVRRGRHRTREDSIRFAIGAAMMWPLALLLVVLEWRIARRSER